MAEESTDPSGNRATVAQTLAEVRGLRDFMDAKFGDVQRQLDRVGELPLTVAALQAQNYDQEKRLKILEDQDRIEAHSDREWMRTHLPALVLAALSLLGTIALIVTNIH